MNACWSLFKKPDNKSQAYMLIFYIIEYIKHVHKTFNIFTEMLSSILKLLTEEIYYIS